MKPLNPLTIPLTSRQLIEASAGTGKTFTLALLYVRLVLGDPDRAGLMPGQILVVTFTDAATQELRERIRSRLTQAAEVFTEQAQKTDSTEALFALRDQNYPDQEHWPTLRYRLLMAAELMDEAAISTIHAWCRRMLAEHAFDSGSLFQMELEKDLDPIRLSAVRDYWRTFVYPLTEQHAKTLASFIKGPEALDSAIRGIVGSDIQSELTPEQVLNAAEVRREPLRQKLISLDWLSLAEQADDTAFKLHHQTRKGLVSFFQKAAEYPDPLIPGGLELSKARHYLDKCPEGEHPITQALNWLIEGLQPDPKIKSELIKHACGWVRQHLQAQCQEAGIMGFDGLLTGLDQALSSEALVKRIRQQFPVALIDEFQDTDPVQYRIFDRLYPANEAGLGLIMIGDPKQAIYAFRGADIFTYLQARQDAGDQVFDMQRNFRSSKAMVDAVNAVFSYRSDPFVLSAQSQQSLPFTQVDAHHQDAPWSDSALTLYYREGEESNKADRLRVNARAMASRIAEYLVNSTRVGDHELQPSDVAVLVNNRDEAHAMRVALQGHKLKSVYLSERQPVYQSVIAKDIAFWLQAALTPGDTDAVRTALSTYALGQSNARLIQLLEDELAFDRELALWQHWHHIWVTQGVLAMLHQLMHHYEVPGFLLNQPNGERELTDLLHLAELLQAMSVPLQGEAALLKAFHAKLRQPEGDSEGQMRLESDADLIQIVTIHKSKGLEYPVVVIPFACNVRPLSPGYDHLTIHDHQDRAQIVIGPSASTVEQADVERLGEDIRKLYVALTRGRYATLVGVDTFKDWHLSGLAYLLDTNAEESLSAAVRRLAQVCPDIAVQPMPEPQPWIFDRSRSTQPRPQPQLTRKIYSPWSIASYSGLAYDEQGNLDERMDDRRSTLAQPKASGMAHQFERGASAGVFLHDLLEFACHRGFSRVVADPTEFQAEVAKRCQTAGFESSPAQVGDWLLRCIQTPLNWGQSQFSLAEAQQSVAEMEFWLQAEQVPVDALDAKVRQQTLGAAPRKAAEARQLNGMLKGFLDLVVCHDDRYYVMDYKSNALGPDDQAYTEPAMRQAILEHRYDLQFSLYTLALHRLLQTRLPDYDYDRHMGGAVYFFLRGVDGPTQGCFAERLPKSLVESMDQMFCGALLL